MSATVPPTPDAGFDPVFRLSVAKYHAMIAAGILTDEDPVELLEGCLVEKMPKHTPHILATRRTNKALGRLLPPGWFIATLDPVTLTDSEPEPDVMAVRGQEEDYAFRNPGPADVALVVEVSDSTLARDQGRKKRIYAAAGLPIYWIVNLIDGRLEVYTDPRGPAASPDYHQRQDFGPNDAVPVVLDGKPIGTIAVRDLLP